MGSVLSLLAGVGDDHPAASLLYVSVVTDDGASVAAAVPVCVCVSECVCMCVCE